MKAEFIKNIIDKHCQSYDLVVLKGFSPDLIQTLGEDFALLDDYVFRDNRIALEEVNENRLMMSIIGCPRGQKAICTCESLIKMCTQITGLGILQKDICVLENNLLELYPNPTHTDIPDFDSDDFMDTESETALFSVFYAFCICEDGVQKVQYIDNYSQTNDCITVRKLIEPKPFRFKGTVCDEHAFPRISPKDASLGSLMEGLYANMKLREREFIVDADDVEDERIATFAHAAEAMGVPVKLYQVQRELAIVPRPELAQLMKRIWGYDSFRNLKIYKDLYVDHSVTEISQGVVVEQVVRQAENAINGKENDVNNILLTSPTGAGKSLLFQLAAIYLAEQYHTLTIVVSPLVALMNDQVDGLTGYEGVAALNGNKTANEKEQILQGVQDGSINLLYLAPELLLSYSITTFLGKRTLGLLVVDEAHTVTTWGRDFRVDYWFLGDYLRKARRTLENNFPIFALTATAVWDPSGRNDMVFDTIRSLNMAPCVKYIGVVRRDNIVFEIEQSGITKNYDLKRNAKTIERIREALEAHRKTIVYFPFKRTINSLVGCDEVRDIRNRIAYYHATLPAIEKTKNATDFREGTRPVMCATKAFGMGIDVSDIGEVYHHAPTGCLSDYVQEIGRLARDPNMTGIAKIDFSPSDFRYIRKLRGLSAIKPYQLTEVLKKLMALFRLNGEKRNMLISASDFSYIFPMAEEDGVDQNLKSCLLLISNDLLNKLRFHALIVRPKSLFSKCFVEVPLNEVDSFHRRYFPYLKRVEENTFILDADKVWMEKFTNQTFARFKANLANGKVFKGFNVVLKNRLTLELHKSVEDTFTQVEKFFHYAHKFLDEMSRTRHRVSFDTMRNALPDSFDDVKREQFIETFRMVYATPKKQGGCNSAYCKVYTTNEGEPSQKDAFQLTTAGYEAVMHFYTSVYRKAVHKKDTCVYCDVSDDIVLLSEFLSSYGLADYQRQGGEQPAIFVRINNPYQLSSLARDKYYKNSILESIYEKHRFSEKIFTYFFTTPMTDEQRWDFIEAYFLGASEEQLLNFV